MIDPLEFVRALESRGVEFFSGVPDSLLQDFCACVADRARPAHHIIAANEGGAVAAAIGYHLATGRIPLVYMQNSGLPNALNPLLSLADPAVYAIPMVMLIGWRGEPGTADEPQHRKVGEITLELLESCQIAYTLLDAETTDAESAVSVVASPRTTGALHAFVVRKGAFSTYAIRETAKNVGSLNREEAIAEAVESMGPDDLVVATTGLTARELYAHRVRRGHSHDRDFLVVGGMGHAAQIAHTLAAHCPDRQVYCLDGDGALLMHMGALAVIGSTRAPNFRHVVLNNGMHESVGGQQTAAAGIDLPAIARAVGYVSAVRVDSLDQLQPSLKELRRIDGPALLEVRISPGHRADVGRPRGHPRERKAAWLTAVIR
jgi:phosphonopyruvate decarboxylase